MEEYRLSRKIKKYPSVPEFKQKIPLVIRTTGI
jgi:hypothetical protein